MLHVCATYMQLLKWPQRMM